MAEPIAAGRRAAFAFIFVTVALDMLALGVMIPVLPRLVVAFRGGDVASAASVVGWFGFVWAGGQFLFSPVVGALSDRFGRRPVVLLSNFGLGLDYLVMALAPSLAWLFVGRVISGITSSSFSTAGAYVADVTPPEDRAAKFGMLGAAFGLGFIVGPAVGGLLGAVNLRLPFWVAAGLSLANAAYGYFVLPESLPPERRVKSSWRMANPVGSLVMVRARPALVGLVVAAFLYYVAHEVWPSLFVLYSGYRYGWGERAVGLALAAVGVCQMLVAVFLVKAAVKRLGEWGTLLAGLGSGMLGSLAGGLATSGAWFALSIPFGGLMGLTMPALQSLMTARVGPTEQGRLQGVVSSVQGVAFMLGPVLFTQVFGRVIGPRAVVQLPGAPYFVAAALLVGAMVAARVSARGGVVVPTAVVAD
jgi:MFS transporter, DHA1 family, tetracycline resistance protein